MSETALVVSASAPLAGKFISGFEVPELAGALNN
jgi:hypothetical protein